jgi:hypothetical protein
MLEQQSSRARRDVLQCGVVAIFPPIQEKEKHIATRKGTAHLGSICRPYVGTLLLRYKLSHEPTGKVFKLSLKWCDFAINATRRMKLPCGRFCGGSGWVGDVNPNGSFPHCKSTVQHKACLEADRIWSTRARIRQFPIVSRLHVETRA